MKVVLGVLLSLMLIGCSGGGGGDGSGGGSTSSAKTGVRILHAAIDHAPMEVYSSENLEAAVQKAGYSEQTFYSNLSASAQTLIVRPYLRPEQLFSFDLDVQKNGHYSLLIYGGEAWNGGLQAKIISDQIPEGVSGAAFKVVNAIHGAASASVSIDGQSVDAGVGFGSATDYLSLTAGVHTVSLSRVVDGHLMGSSVITLEEGVPYTLLMSGEVGYFVKAQLFED